MYFFGIGLTAFSYPTITSATLLPSPIFSFDAALDTSNAKQLEKIAELYEEMGIEAKAAVYRNRAKNQIVKD